MKHSVLVYAAFLCLALNAMAPSSLKAQSTSKFTKQQLTDASLIQKLPGFKNGYATVNGVKIHYVKGGNGKPLILLPGWPQTWWSYHKMMPSLAKKYTVIVIDIRGMGGSEKPATGYDKKTMAKDVNDLVHQLGYQKAFIAGHDIGAQVAFSVAANYPDITEKLVIIDVPHPDETFAATLMLPAIGTSTEKLDPAHPFLWWFAFNQLKEMPQELLVGRINIFQQYVFDYLLGNKSAISSFDRAVYANAYDNKDAIRAGNAWYQTFSQDILDYQNYKNIEMPVLGIGGPGYDWLSYVLPKKATHVQVLKAEGSGHFVPEEQPEITVKYMKDFFN